MTREMLGHIGFIGFCLLWFYTVVDMFGYERLDREYKLGEHRDELEDYWNH